MPRSPSRHVRPQPLRWGGRRPGAGAPKGNLNGIKHGLRSKRLRGLAERWAHDPEMRSVLAAFTRYTVAKQRAALAVALWLRRTGVSGHDLPWEGPAPPPMTQRELNLYARTLAKRAIKKVKKDGIRRRP